MENFTFAKGRFFSEAFQCQCGQEHYVPIQDIRVKHQALEDIGVVARQLNIGKKCLVIADLNTYAVAGKKVMEVLAAHSLKIGAGKREQDGRTVGRYGC